MREKYESLSLALLKDLAKAESYFEERSLKLQRTRNGLLLPLEEKARRKEMLEVIHRNFPVEALAEYIFPRIIHWSAIRETNGRKPSGIFLICIS